MAPVVLLAFAPAIGCNNIPDTSIADIEVSGDTTGLPARCDASAAVKAIKHWFRAVETGDPRMIAASISRRFAWISVSPFTPAESLFTTRRWNDLDTYASARAGARERLRLRSVTFTGWRNSALNFGPVHFTRSAEDLGPDTLDGIGKGAYACGDGLIAFSTAPTHRIFGN
jgi:hypothetical protein